MNERVRAQFPILSRKVNGRDLVYLDNAATTQKPESVLSAMDLYYRQFNANIHRGVHCLSVAATEAFEGARRKVRDFIHAKEDAEVIFVRGTTEGINLVAQSYGRTFLKPGDEIIISGLEHHSNLVPWQMLRDQVGCVLRQWQIDERGELPLSGLEPLLNGKTKILAIAHASNALGTLNPLSEIIQRVRDFRKDIVVMVDGAQAVPHLKVDVQALGCDFYTFSAHKIYGPTGVGVLYGRRDLLERMPPYQGGGDMIRSVTFERSTYNSLPYKFEAGTPHVEGVIGLGAAIEFVNVLGIDSIARHEMTLLHYSTQKMKEVEGVRLIGTAHEKVGVLSFLMQGVHPHDIGTILDQQGIAVRTGHHCAQPVMEYFKIPATVRASFAVYNTQAEVDALISGLKTVRELFAESR